MKDLGKMIYPGLIGGGAFADTRREEFDHKNATILANNIDVDVCFIGDSITHFWETAAMFRDCGTVINRGIGGDDVSGLLHRFAADALQLEPRITVVLIGFNNLLCLKEIEDEGSPEYTAKAEEVFNTVVSGWRDIIEACRGHNQRLIMCSLLPTVWPPKLNNMIFRLNDALRALCRETGTELCDWHGALLGGDAFSVNYDLTFDGTHPNGFGYAKMKEALRPYLDEALR